LRPEWAQEFFGLASPPSIFGRAWLVMSLAELGRFAEATRHETEALRIAEPMQHAHAIGWACLPASIPYLLRGDWAKARALIDRWITLSRSLDVAILLPWAAASSAWALAQMGEADGALSRLREAEELLERQTASGIAGHRSWAYQGVSRAYLALGRLDEAWRYGHLSIESARRQPGFRAHALRLLGDLATHPDRFDADSGAAHYLEALTIAESHGMRPLIAHCQFGLGKLYDRIRQTDRAREKLATATAMYRAMGMDSWLDQGGRTGRIARARRDAGRSGKRSLV
jgi:tetratricopeptide (TPR) repeat protein